MAVSPINIQSDLVTFSIQSNGKEIDPVFQVSSIVIDKFINKKDSAEITLLAGNSENGFSEITDNEIFIPGTKIDIYLGYNNNNEKIFTGSISKQAVQAKSGNASLLKIICGKKNKPLKKIDTATPPSLQVEYGADIMEIELALNEKYKLSVLTKYNGYIVFQGSTLAKENSMLSVKGFGTRFDGNLFISGIEHRISDGNWLTKVKIGVQRELLDEFKSLIKKNKK